MQLAFRQNQKDTFPHRLCPTTLGAVKLGGRKITELSFHGLEKPFDDPGVNDRQMVAIPLLQFP